MPQASDEHRARWNGPDDSYAQQYLKNMGYRLNRDWTWTPPAGREPTRMELDAIAFLINEWDMGGVWLGAGQYLLPGPDDSWARTA